MVASYDPRNETRHCDVCGRDIRLDALRPGWEVVRVDGEPAWSCPDCSRKAGLFGPTPI